LIINLVLAASFIVIIIILVIYIGTWEFISPTNQMFFTSFIGLLPYLFKIVFYKGDSDCDIFFETEEFNEKLNRYKEQFEEIREENNQNARNRQESIHQRSIGERNSHLEGNEDIEKGSTDKKTKKLRNKSQQVNQYLNLTYQDETNPLDPSQKQRYS
ncbi:hypothetical protein BgiMline_010240, partial [Biomphalaria glabrata]